MSDDLSKKYDAKFYANQKAGSLKSAETVLGHVLPIIGTPRSVIDIGCGAGGWLRTLSEIVDDLDIFGVDHPGAPTSEMFIDPANFEGRDLSATMTFDRKFDLAISLEVAEHIDPQQADIFVDNLMRHADTILFSAAIPRQGGTGHVNEQWPQYWIEKMSKRGFGLCDVVRPLIWNEDDVASWYKQNLLLFASDRAAMSVAGLEDWGGRAMVHPGAWIKKTEPIGSQIRRVLKGERPSEAWR